MSVDVGACAHLSQVLGSLENRVGSQKLKLTDLCEPVEVSAWNRTGDLWKGRKCS